MKGEAPNQSKNYNRVFKKGDVQEGGSLGYAVASLLRALARKQGKKPATKSEYPKSNVKVVKPKKAPVGKKIDPRRKAKEYPSSKPYPKPVKKRAPAKRSPDPARAKRTPEQIAAARDATKPLVKKKAPAKKRAPQQRDFERIREANRQARALRARRDS